MFVLPEALKAFIKSHEQSPDSRKTIALFITLCNIFRSTIVKGLSLDYVFNIMHMLSTFINEIFNVFSEYVSVAISSYINLWSQIIDTM